MTHSAHSKFLLHFEPSSTANVIHNTKTSIIMCNKNIFGQTFLKHSRYIYPESTKQMEEILNFHVPKEGLELVILLHTQY